jgi:serine/threonine-protein kinase HipA
MAYRLTLPPESLVSLTMAVRTESYLWDDELRTIFRMNPPEGYLLQILQEEGDSIHTSAQHQGFIA